MGARLHPIEKQQISLKILGCIVAPKPPDFAFTMHPNCLNLGAILHPSKIAVGFLKKSGCIVAPNPPDFAFTMHPNTLFLGARLHPSHIFMIFGGFRGRSPLTRCIFETKSNKMRIWHPISWKSNLRSSRSNFIDITQCNFIFQVVVFERITFSCNC